jgi:hypothetical protein
MDKALFEVVSVFTTFPPIKSFFKSVFAAPLVPDFAVMVLIAVFDPVYSIWST